MSDAPLANGKPDAGKNHRVLQVTNAPPSITITPFINVEPLLATALQSTPPKNMYMVCKIIAAKSGLPSYVWKDPENLERR